VRERIEVRVTINNFSIVLPNKVGALRTKKRDKISSTSHIKGIL